MTVSSDRGTYSNTVVLEGRSRSIPNQDDVEIYVPCPNGSSTAIAKLVIAPHDCRSQIMVSYAADSQSTNFNRSLGCASESSIRSLFQNNQIQDADMTNIEDYYQGNGAPLLICLSELEGQISSDSQPLVSVEMIQQNIQRNGGLVLESYGR